MFTVSSSSLLPPCNLLHFTTFLILHKGLPTTKNMKRKPWTNWRRNQFPAGSLKTVMRQQASFLPLLLPTSTSRMTHHIYSPLPVALLSLPWKQAQAETLRDLKHFSSSSKNPPYSDPLPAQEKGWTLSTGQQAHAERTCSMILASYTWCLCRNSCLHNSEATPPKLSFAKLTETKRLKTTEYWNSTLQVTKG